MCTSGVHQCKTAPIQGLHVLVHHKQTWMFSLHDIAIKVAKCTKYDIKAYNILSFPSIICADKRDLDYKVSEQ